MAWPPFFIPSPLDGLKPGEATPNVEHLPITTRKGRVIYNRKPHKFTENDVLRVSATYFGIYRDKKNANWLLRLMEALTIWMMDKIIERLAGEEIEDEVAGSLYYILRDTLARFIDRLPARVLEVLEKNPIYPYIP